MKNVNLKPILLSLLFLISGNCFAMGMGVTVSDSNEIWRDSARSPVTNVNHDVNSFGFMLDTNESGRKIFGYRFAFLLEKNESEDKSVRLEGYATTHDFTFSLYSNNYFRLWLGPRLKAVRYDDVRINGVETFDDVEGLLFGPVVGFNVFLNKVVGLSFSVARLNGDYDRRRYIFSTSSDYDIDANSRPVTLDASLVFRFGNKRFRR